MTEKLLVTFSPKGQYRFFYEEVRIETSQGDRLILPVYACPSMGDIAFPKYINFGICPLNSLHSKTFIVKSTAKIPFEFKIDTHGLRPEFTVSPVFGNLNESNI